MRPGCAGSRERPRMRRVNLWLQPGIPLGETAGLARREERGDRVRLAVVADGDVYVDVVPRRRRADVTRAASLPVRAGRGIAGGRGGLVVPYRVQRQSRAWRPVVQ